MIRILRGNQPNLSQLREESYQEGYQKGFSDGQQAALVRLFAQRREAQQQQQQRQRESVALALQIAKRVIGEALQENTAVSRAMEEALQAAEGKALQLRVHPDDELMVRSALGARCTLVVDTTLSRGGCWIDTEWGAIDARLETQLTLIAELLESETR